MDLWIRSQNREMLRINPELEIYEYGNKKFLVIDTKGYTNYDKAKVLGEYKTKERAYEVLDEIHEHLDYLNIGNINRVDEKGFRVSTIYNMPEE